MTSRTLAFSSHIRVLIVGALAISPATLGRTNGQRESHGAQEGVIPMERLSWWRGEERSTAKQLACEP